MQCSQGLAEVAVENNKEGSLPYTAPSNRKRDKFFVSCTHIGGGGGGGARFFF